MIYVMSDIHGQKRRFDSVMKQINLQPEDTLYPWRCDRPQPRRHQALTPDHGDAKCQNASGQPRTYDDERTLLPAPRR